MSMKTPTEFAYYLDAFRPGDWLDEDTIDTMAAEIKLRDEQIQSDAYQASVESEREEYKKALSFSYALGKEAGKKEGWKEGMLEASKICLSTIDENGSAGASECSERILTAIENKGK